MREPDVHALSFITLKYVCVEHNQVEILLPGIDRSYERISNDGLRKYEHVGGVQKSE